MAVFRVEKTTDYTVMSNHHLRNNTLSLRAKGLLSQILSLPEGWDYTLAGLAAINKEGVAAIRTAVQELEQAGYIVRRQTMGSDGKFAGNEYIIHEEPVAISAEEIPEEVPGESTGETPEKVPEETTEECAEPLCDFTTTEKPLAEKPLSENRTQLNKDISSKDISKKKNKKKKPPAKKGTIPELELNDLLPMFISWIQRMADTYHWQKDQMNEVYKNLVAWYSPRTIKNGGPPVKSQLGVTKLCNNLENGSGGNVVIVIEALVNAMGEGWTSVHPEKLRENNADRGGYRARNAPDPTGGAKWV